MDQLVSDMWYFFKLILYWGSTRINNEKKVIEKIENTNLREKTPLPIKRIKIWGKREIINEQTNK